MRNRPFIALPFILSAAAALATAAAISPVLALAQAPAGSTGPSTTSILPPPPVSSTPPPAVVAPVNTARATSSSAASAATNGRIPAFAIPSLGLETSVAWRWVHDDQTKGASKGESEYPIYPDGRSGLPGRKFVTWYDGKGGERYHLTFGRDESATHFVYEANVYLVDPKEIANVEMDMNQVMSDGRTVIFGTQCAVDSKSWEYTYVNKTGTHWHRSNIKCNPQTWGTKQWHKVQIASHRDDSGNVTYDWIGFDGVYTDFQDATVFSAESLGWFPGELLLNFQIDGAHITGTMDAYLNNLAVYRW
jgi:hypothetical protein